MSEEEQPLLIPAASDADADRDQLDIDVASIRATLFWVVVGLILLSAAVNGFLWRQVQNVRAEIYAEQMQINEYGKADPAVRDLLQRLQVFAASHPDFQPVMAKYGSPQTNAANTQKIQPPPRR